MPNCNVAELDIVIPNSRYIVDSRLTRQMFDKLLHLHVVIINIDEDNISTVKIIFRLLCNRKHILGSIKPVTKSITTLDLPLKFLHCQ